MSLDKEIKNEIKLDKWHASAQSGERNVHDHLSNESNNFTVFNRLFKNIFVRWNKDFREYFVDFQNPYGGKLKDETKKLEDYGEANMSELIIFDEDLLHVEVKIEVDYDQLNKMIKNLG